MKRGELVRSRLSYCDDVMWIKSRIHRHFATKLHLFTLIHVTRDVRRATIRRVRVLKVFYTTNKVNTHANLDISLFSFVKYSSR